jgi:hypothetical protein
LYPSAILPKDIDDELSFHFTPLLRCSYRRSRIWTDGFDRTEDDEVMYSVMKILTIHYVMEKEEERD